MTDQILNNESDRDEGEISFGKQCIEMTSQYCLFPNHRLANVYF